jgi:hypothetical protein
MTEHEFDFDALATAARASNGSRDALDALWGSVYALDYWFFIARGEMPNLTPYCAVIEGKPMVHIFTDSDRCDACARQFGFADENDCTPLIAMGPDGLIGWLELLQANNVWGMYFNHGLNNFFAPLTNTVPMLEYFEERRKHGVHLSKCS